ncbi:hypothetical protein SAMN02799624_05188 [Paenibacillus sp. UNC496MF]|uniref:hypothetical protein n=1 Tax=Paenibacillus sp. UNC496MF TaxID=1502753 RepID=UPI0008F14EF4|nr:hypothetical protein [Paenibacillus sp. UNC496MF]SFJ59877.1 hypothetical protein SAMN02799624_05188 [Paenibacillus sp. UNC496MF]
MEKIQLLEELKNDMLLGIKNAVQEIKLKDNDEVCYIALMGSDYEPVLGLITLGIKSFRDEMTIEEKKDKFWYLWNSAEMPANYQVGPNKVSESFDDKQATFVKLAEDDDWDETWELCQNVRFEVANQLNNVDWKDSLPITDEFVVYSEWEAIDVTNGDLEKSLPEEKLYLLKKRGLI